MCIKLSCFYTCNFFRQKRDENGNGNDDEDDDYDDDENFRHYDSLITPILVSKIQWNRNISTVIFLQFNAKFCYILLQQS